MMIVIISHKSVTFRFWIFWVSKLFHFLHGVGFGSEKIGFEKSIGFSMMILTISHHDDSSFSSDLHSDSLFLHPRVTVTSKPFLYLIINIYCHFCDNHWINCHHSIKLWYPDADQESTSQPSHFSICSWGWQITNTIAIWQSIPTFQDTLVQLWRLN